MLLKYTDVFTDPSGKPGKTLLGMHEIKLEDETPSKEPPRIVPLLKKDILEEDISKLEENGLIENSCSP